ncbi:MAG: hypothetical protein QOJ16_1096 [Acidobacteriota bacterium]|jgi:hypothetical protein|nr:hypothetical protein [Acidobacteriota bacterium]
MPIRVAPVVSSLGCLLLAATLGVPLGTSAARADEGIADPCKLVTPEEVQLVLGTPVDRSSEVHVKDAVKFPVRICSFHGKNGKVLNVSTGVKTAADFATEWTGHDAIAEVGDAAFAVPPGVLVFHKGTSTCKFQALNFDFARDGHGRGYADPALAAKLKTLALAAVARM